MEEIIITYKIFRGEDHARELSRPITAQTSDNVKSPTRRNLKLNLQNWPRVSACFPTVSASRQ